MPRIIPNSFDNTILVQATPQEWEQIRSLLEKIDVAPRQVLIEAKIYEVDLSGAFSSGVSAAFNAATGAAAGKSNAFFPSLAQTATGAISAGGIALTASALVGRHRELLAFLTAQEDSRRSRVISAPSIVATDNIGASITVGAEVPVLASQGLGIGAQVNGNTLFANTISNRNTGVTLSILAHINPSGIVTMVINQEVSAAEPPAANAAIQSPSIAKKNVSTQVTVQDGDTVAIGGVIQETKLNSSAGVPGLHKIPILGGFFGAKSISNQRTELVIFLTPRIIYDTNQVTEASDELKNQMQKLKKLYRE
jgi:general secretion pathway protein D